MLSNSGVIERNMCVTRDSTSIGETYKLILRIASTEPDLISWKSRLNHLFGVVDMFYII